MCVSILSRSNYSLKIQKGKVTQTLTRSRNLGVLARANAIKMLKMVKSDDLLG